MQPPDILQFNDYRSFLKAYASLRQAKDPMSTRRPSLKTSIDKSSWSLSLWARRLKLRGTASLTMVLNGQRNPGPEMIERMVRYFNFDTQRAEYFRDLVTLQKLKKDPALASLMVTKIKQRHPEKSLRFVDEETFAVMSEWYYVAIREMTLLADFVEDPTWIAERLGMRISYKQARQAIKTLLDLQLLERDERGTLRPSSGVFSAGGINAHEAVRRYQLAVLEQAKQAILRTPFALRREAASTITIDPKDLPKVKELVETFQAQLAQLVETCPGRETYQMSLQFFPLTVAVRSTNDESIH